MVPPNGAVDKVASVKFDGVRLPCASYFVIRWLLRLTRDDPGFRSCQGSVDGACGGRRSERRWPVFIVIPYCRQCAVTCAWNDCHTGSAPVGKPSRLTWNTKPVLARLFWTHARSSPDHFSSGPEGRKSWVLRVLWPGSCKNKSIKRWRRLLRSNNILQMDRVPR